MFNCGNVGARYFFRTLVVILPTNILYKSYQNLQSIQKKNSTFE